MEEHYRGIQLVLIWVLILNWAVAFAKILYGLLSRCASMTADGFHSLSDGTSNIVGLIGVNLASKPRDAEHPYGHKKYETFFSLGIAALLILVCVDLVQEGIKRLRNPVIPRIDTLSFLIMLITMGINFLVMRYEYNKGKGLQSDILISDSLHTRADLFTSLSVIIALVAVKLGYPVLDPLATMVIAAFIAYAAFEIVQQSSKILCDTIAIVDIRRIRDIVLDIKGVKACHKIRTRGRPDDIHIDLHVQVDGDMHMDKAHQISYTIEDAIRKGIPGVTDVVVHMEPQEKKR